MREHGSTAKHGSTETRKRGNAETGKRGNASARHPRSQGAGQTRAARSAGSADEDRGLVRQVEEVLRGHTEGDGDRHTDADRGHGQR